MKRKLNPENERIKLTYFHFLENADGKAMATIRQIEKAIRAFTPRIDGIDASISSNGCTRQSVNDHQRSHSQANTHKGNTNNHHRQAPTYHSTGVYRPHGGVSKLLERFKPKDPSRTSVRNIRKN
jgi:hypothetical protein